MKTLFIGLFLILFCIHSQAQKRLLKAAEDYEAQGFYEKAAEKYMEALYNNATNGEYLAGLQRTAQKVMDEKLSLFFVQASSGEIEKALKTFEETDVYAGKLTYFKIELKLPEHYKTDYKQKKDALLDILYEEGRAVLTKDDFQSAFEKFEKIAYYDSGYRDVKQLMQVASIESLYRRAVQAFNNGNYSAAWESFEKVRKRNSSFKETPRYQEKIIEATGITLSILPVQTIKHVPENQLRSAIQASISQLKNPMLRVVDRENMEAIFKEQKLGLSGMIDESSAAKVGKVLGAKFVLVTSLVQCTFSDGPLVRSEKIAYEGNQLAVRDPVTGAINYPTQYKPSVYNEYQKRNALHFTFQYQLISSETALVVTSDIINEEIADDVLYAEYSGNYLNLYPASGDKIYKSGKERDEFLALFTNKRAPSARKDLDFRWQTVLGEKVAASLNAYWRNLN